MQRRSGVDKAFELQALRQARPQLSLAELEAEAMNRLEFVRIATRVTPMLGLVATMIPMGPALHALGDGQLADVANNLTAAFGRHPGPAGGGHHLRRGPRPPPLVRRRTAPT